MLTRNSVVISGVGILAANGSGKPAFWQSLLAGESGVDRISLCDTTDLSCTLAGEVKSFDLKTHVGDRLKPRQHSRNTQLAAAAAMMAIEDAGLDSTHMKRFAPVHIFLGVSMGGFDFIEREIRRIVAKGNLSIRPSVVGCIHIAAASTIASLLEVPTQVGTWSNSCVGGLDAIGHAASLIREGKSDIALAGATDAPIETSLVAGFCAARMLSTWQGEPRKASRPFDRDRCGGVLAEGSAVVVLERLDHALGRGAVPYAEVVGYGTASDPERQSGSGLAQSMRQAMANASWMPNDVDVICAHGPSDLGLDAEECRRIKETLGAHALRVPLFSIKGATGNPLSAGGAMQAVASALALRNQCVPPTANYEFPDPDCDLEILAGRSYPLHVRNLLINAHGSGRVNSTLLLKAIAP